MPTSYKGCTIWFSEQANGYVWECELYGAESDDAFDTIDEAKRNIDVYFPGSRTPRVINNEIIA